MLKLVHEVAWQFGVQLWTDVWTGHFYNCF